MNLINFINSVKKKYHIASNKDFAIIFIIFSLAGLFVSISRKTIFACLGLNHTSLLLQILFSLLLIVPLYQVSTLILGFIFGKFNFFWERQKVLGRFLRRVFIRSS